MKKLKYLAIIIAALAAGAYFYYVNKFDHIANEQIIPRIKEGKFIVSADPNNIHYHKYLFKITLDDCKIMPDDELYDINIKKVEIDYNPLSNNIIIKTLGNNLNIENQNGEILKASSPDIELKFNCELLFKNFDKTNVNFYAKNIEILNSKGEETFKSPNLRADFVSNLDKKDKYDVSLDIKGNITGLTNSLSLTDEITDLFAEKINKFSDLSLSDDGDKEDNSTNYKKLKKLINKVKAINYGLNKDSEIKYSVKTQLSKEQVAKFIEAFEQELSFTDFVLANKNLYDNFYFKISEFLKNNNIENESKIDFTKNNNDYSLVSDSDIKFKASDKEKSEINNKLIELNDEFQIINLTDDSKKSILELLNNYVVKKYSNKLDVKFNSDSYDLDGYIKLSLNDENYNMDFSHKNKEANLNVKLDSPKKIINFINDMNDKFLKVIARDNEGKFNEDNYRLIYDNIRDNSYNFLKTIHKNGELGDSNFETDIKFKLNLFNPDFKINNKPITEYLEIEDFSKFIENF